MVDDLERAGLVSFQPVDLDREQVTIDNDPLASF